MPPERRSPLHSAHVALGAKLVPFGGWEMPLAYESGTLAEHMACRQAAVVFDVSHLGTLRVVGDRAFDALQRAFTNDLARISPGHAQYTHLLDPADGSVLDDIIVWWVDTDRFEVMPNASNTDRVANALGLGDLALEDVTSTRAVLAVQGPDARARLEAIAPAVNTVGRFRVGSVTIAGVEVLAAGTGYTGEDGIEIAVPVETAHQVWDAIVAEGVEPAGLGARDTLRLEAGLPLHGHELGPGITPGQAGLDWVVRMDKGEFRGRAALEAEALGGLPKRLHGLLTPGRRPPRAGQVVKLDGVEVGTVSSGNFSPVLEQGIALAFIDRKLEPTTPVTIDVRGTETAAVVHTLPFV